MKQPADRQTIWNILLVLKILKFLIIFGVSVNCSVYFKDKWLTVVAVCLLVEALIREFIRSFRESFLRFSDYRAIVELVIGIGLARTEVIYAVLCYDDALDIIIIHSIFYWIHDFASQYFYDYQDFPELDDFTKLSMFLICVTFQSLIHKKVMLFGFLMGCLSFPISIMYIRLIQWKLLNESELPTVAIYSANKYSEGSADVGHLYVRINNLTYEIFKDENGISHKKIEAQRHPRNPAKWYGSDKNFYIPFFNYGVVGLEHGMSRKYPKTMAEIIYEDLIKENDNYNSSTNSCQEFVMKFAYRLTETETKVKFFTTNLKSFLTLGLTSLPFLTFAAVKNVSIQWK